MPFETFQSLIQKEFIDQVLTPYCPEIIYLNEKRGQYYPRLEVGVKTSLCNFLFVWGEDGGGMIGPLSNIFQNPKKDWYNLDRIISFVKKQPFRDIEMKSNISRSERILTIIRAEREGIETHTEQIMMMFSSHQRTSEWEKEYKDYEREQFTKKYPQFTDRFNKLE